jgi:hypothetical protein
MHATVAGPVIDGAIGQPAPTLRCFVHAYLGSWFECLTPGSHQGLPYCRQVPRWVPRLPARRP